MTRPQYKMFDDTSTTMYGSGVGKPRWLNNRQAAVWRAYIHMNENLYATLEDKLSRDS